MAGKKDSTSDTTRKGEAERAIAGVGGIHSSEEDMPDLSARRKEESSRHWWPTFTCIFWMKR